MPKSSQEQIEIDEKKVIDELQKDAKQSIDKIGKNCGFSRQKVWRILKKLEENKIIWGYRPVVDYEKLNLKRYLILIKRTNKPFTIENVDIITSRKLKEATSKYQINIINSYFIHGLHDWFISVTAKDIRDVKKVIEIFTTILIDFIENVEVLEVIFPVEINNCPNPNVNQIKEFFR